MTLEGGTRSLVVPSSPGHPRAYDRVTLALQNRNYRSPSRPFPPPGDYRFFFNEHSKISNVLIVLVREVGIVGAREKKK